MPYIPNNTKEQIEEIRHKCDLIKPLVSIRCITYNHELYIRDALEGFVMQKTKFPFVAIVHDDASTDGTANIIREYADKYPDIIKPIFESENQYSKKDGTLTSIMDKACEATGAKYVAMCEGDDYWTDPLKLQKQVDFLESHPYYSMCFHNVNFYDQCNSKTIQRKGNYKNNHIAPTHDIIMGGGAFCPTCSIVYRYEKLNKFPDFAKKFSVGDYPLQIFLSILGNVMYFNEVFANYRINIPTSWSAFNEKNISKEIREDNILKIINFLNGFDVFTHYKFHKSFKSKIRNEWYLFYFSSRNKIKSLYYLPCSFKEFIKWLLMAVDLYPSILILNKKIRSYCKRILL